MGIMIENLRTFWNNSWKVIPSLLIGIAIGVSITSHFYSVWGKSLWIQIGTIAGLGIVWGAVIYWGLFRSQIGKKIAWKKGGFWPNVIVASVLLGFIRLPTFTHVVPLLFEVEVMPNIGDESVGIISIKYGDGQDISFQELEKSGRWTSENGMLVGQGAGSRVSYRVISEKNGKHWGEVKIIFQQSPTSGRVSIRMDGIGNIIDLKGDDINSETLVVVPVAPSPLRAFLLGLCDLLTMITALFFFSIFAFQIMQQMSGKYRMPQIIARIGNLSANRIKKAWAPPLILFFYTFLAHGLLLLNEGIYSDDYLYVTYLIKRDWNALFSLFDQTGRPLLALMHWPFTIFPDIIFGYKVVIFVLIFLSALLVYSICKRSGYLSQNESLLLAVFSMTFPANQFFVAIGMSSYYILYTLYLLAAYLDIVSLGEKRSRRVWLFAGSVILFFFSFTLSSLLVFYYGYLLVRYFIILKIKNTSVIKASVWQVSIIASVGILCLLTGLFMDRVDRLIPQLSYFRIIFVYLGSACLCVFAFLFVQRIVERSTSKKVMDLSPSSSMGDDSNDETKKGRLLTFPINRIEILTTAILGLFPIANYFVTMSFFKPYGYYGGYNGINPSSLFSTGLLINGFDYISNGVLSHIVDNAWLLAFLAFLLFLLAHNGKYFKESRKSGLGLLIIGSIILGTGIFPYLVRGTPSAPSGSYTRNFILLALPMSIIIVGFIRWSFSGDLSTRRIGILFSFILVFVFSLSYIQSYLEWQGRTIWEKSVVLNLKKQPEFYKNTVFWVDSEFTRVGFKGDKEVNEPWVWIGLFRQASGDESHFGGDIRYFGGDVLQRKWEQYEHRVQNYFNFLDDVNQNGISIFRRRDMWLVSDFDPYGCQGILSIIRGDGAQSAIKSARTYYYDKFFRPDQMENYLKQLTQLKIRHLDTPLATNCIR